ncbi:MAG: hypothetical protein JO197_08585 [Acidobacteria bacterium]|nr:hypothetical protein [Acidobacteriota bacterium]MBV9478043.1 hypothetical protein [Acidobacteriota bacterium]
MKPIHLNLASRPYRDYRPVYAAVVLMSLLAAFLMLNNISTYYRYVHETKSTRAQIATVESQAAQERERAQVSQRRLQSLDLAGLDERTRFINQKLAQRAFSWSALLDELESVLSDDVRLSSVTPAFTPNGIQLSLLFDSKSADGMLTTIDRMNRDPRFYHPFPSNETLDPTGGYHFSLTVGYRPDAPHAGATR